MPSAPPPRRRLALVLGGALTALLLLCGTGAVAAGLLIRSGGPEDADRAVVADAARAWASDLPGVRLNLWLADEEGQRTHGRVTVTADGDAAGTLTQPGGGTASLRAHDGTTALDGDRTWHSRAATSRSERPTIDVTGAFTPDRLAAMIASAVTSAHTVEPVGDINGQDLVRYTDGPWTLYLTAAAPHALVYLEGPVAPGSPVAPAAALTPPGPGTDEVPPVDAATATVVPADNEYRNPYVAAAVSPATSAQAANATATARGGTPTTTPPASEAPDGSDAPSSRTSPTPAPASPAPDQTRAARTALPAAFAVTVQPVPQYCGNPRCAVRISARNTGGTPARVSLFVTVVPGLAPTRLDAGTVRPGAATQDFLVTYPNVVYATGGQIRTTLYGWAFSPDLDGPDPALKQRLAMLGINPDADPVLGRLDGPDRQIALRTLDLATRHLSAGDTRDVLAARLAVRRAVAKGLLPELDALSTHADRLGNPADLTANLTVVDDDTRPPDQQVPAGIGHRRELEQVAHLLRTRPRARITYDGYLADPETGRRYRADLLIEDGSDKTAVQVKTVSGRQGLRKALTTAIGQLNGDSGVGNGTPTPRGVDADGAIEQAPPGFRREVLLHLEPGTGELFTADKPTLQRRLADFDLARHLCHDGRYRAERLVLVNGADTHTWTTAQFHALGASGAQCP
ncbi:hypothetical protein [Cryptosporangium aurantiacum]|nr:hypothetical protein [Cryptosporangium aurantiacum]